MGNFAADLSRFADRTEKKLDLLVRKIGLELFSRVIVNTPVDTGRARANWQVAINSVPTGTLELSDKDGTAAISAADAAVSGLKAGDTIYLANNLPYIQKLEDGSSTQAPAGMVGLAVQDFQNIARHVGFELVLL